MAIRPDPAPWNLAAEGKVGELIADIDPGAVVVGFVGVIEVVDTDGDRCLWTVTHPDAKPWDVLGYLEHARILEDLPHGDHD